MRLTVSLVHKLVGYETGHQRVSPSFGQGWQDLCGLVSFSLSFLLFSFLFFGDLVSRNVYENEESTVRRELSKAFRKLSSPWIVTHEMRLGQLILSQLLSTSCDRVRDQLPFTEDISNFLWSEIFLIGIDFFVIEEKCVSFRSLAIVIFYW